MANPGPIASLFWLDDALDSRLRLDGIVTLCDAAHIREQLQTTEEAGQQIAYADRILLNKMDLVNNNSNDEMALRELIRQYHPMAPIRSTTFSSVPDLDWILDAHCFDSDRFQLVEDSIQKLQQQEEQEKQSSTSEHDHHHSHDHDHGEDCAICQKEPAVHKHTSGITSFALIEEGTLDLQKLNRWLASALWPNQDATNAKLQAMIQDDAKVAAHQSLEDGAQRVFRIKGVVSVRQYLASDTYDVKYVEDDDITDKRRFILQSVHDLWDLYPANDALQWQADEQRTSKVIIIGKNLDEASLRQGFRECLVT